MVVSCQKVLDACEKAAALLSGGDALPLVSLEMSSRKTLRFANKSNFFNQNVSLSHLDYPEFKASLGETNKAFFLKLPEFGVPILCSYKYVVGSPTFKISFFHPYVKDDVDFSPIKTFHSKWFEFQDKVTKTTHHNFEHFLGILDSVFSSDSLVSRYKSSLFWYFLWPRWPLLLPWRSAVSGVFYNCCALKLVHF